MVADLCHVVFSPGAPPCTAQKHDKTAICHSFAWHGERTELRQMRAITRHIKCVKFSIICRCFAFLHWRGKRLKTQNHNKCWLCRVVVFSTYCPFALPLQKHEDMTHWFFSAFPPFAPPMWKHEHRTHWHRFYICLFGMCMRIRIYLFVRRGASLKRQKSQCVISLCFRTGRAKGRKK